MFLPDFHLGWLDKQGMGQINPGQQRGNSDWIVSARRAIMQVFPPVF